MDIKDAKSLVVKLTNAAYEAGLWEDHLDKTLTPKWQKRAEKIGDEIVRHLISTSTRPNYARACACRLGMPEEYYKDCPICGQKSSG